MLLLPYFWLFCIYVYKHIRRDICFLGTGFDIRSCIHDFPTCFFRDFDVNG